MKEIMGYPALPVKGGVSHLFYCSLIPRPITPFQIFQSRTHFSLERVKFAQFGVFDGAFKAGKALFQAGG